MGTAKMITVYRQDQKQARSKYCFKFVANDSSTEAIKWGIENKRIFPGDIAITLHSNPDGTINVGKVMKHWAIFHRHGEIEAVPDRIGVPIKHTDWRYYREYMKFGRFKSLWYKLRKKRV